MKEKEKKIEIDYTRLDAQIRCYKMLERSYFVDLTELDAAVTKGEQLKTQIESSRADSEAEQRKVDETAEPIKKIIYGLELKGVDHKKLDKLCDELEGLDREDYTEESWKGLSDEIEASRRLHYLDIRYQDFVDDTVADLFKRKESLVKKEIGDRKDNL